MLALIGDDNSSLVFFSIGKNALLSASGKDEVIVVLRSLILLVMTDSSVAK
jgi:hypothetical protein